MEFRVTKDLFDLYPELQLVVCVAQDCDNHTGHPELGEQMEKEQAIIRRLFPSTAAIAQHPSVACWRSAYRAFGVGSEYRSSVEALVRRTVKGETIPQINTIVDCYNMISLKYLLPIGGEDLLKLRGDLELARARGGESFMTLGHDEDDPPKSGEVIYRDTQGCVCRRFNWREAERTKLTNATKHGLLTVEGVPPITDIELKEAAAALGSLLERFCGAAMDYFLVNANRPFLTIPLP